MTTAQIYVLVILLVTLVLVAANRLRPDLGALLLAGLLGLAQFAGLPVLSASGERSAALQAVSGFGQPTVVTLISLFIITRALEKSGITRWITRYLLRLGGQSETRLIALFAAATAFLSLFMNNLAAGALLLPSALEAGHATGIKPSKLLIPVAYGSLFGGAATYFTTANIVVSGLLPIANPPQSPLNVLDFTPTGGLIAIGGIAFMALFGHRLLPDRDPGLAGSMLRPTGSDLEDAYGVGERLWEGTVTGNSPYARKTIQESEIGEGLGVTIAAIQRGRELIFPIQPDERLLPGDDLVIVGRQENVELLAEQGVQIKRSRPGAHISSMGLTLIEVAPAPRSAAEGRTLRELAFRRVYGLTAIALWRRGRNYRTGVADIPLQLGDSLLMIGSLKDFQRLRASTDFTVLEPSLSDQPVQPIPAWTSLAIVAAGVAASIAGVPVALAMLVAAVATMLLGLLNMEEAYRTIEWQAVFLIAGMVSVSLAMVETGLAKAAGDWMVAIVAPWGPLGLAAGAFVLTSLLTQVMGGQVTALVTGPIAISAAISLGVNPQAIAVATALGCSVSFLTPLAHPVNILMIAPANYSFGDFFRIGLPLTVLSFALMMLGMVLFWGF